MIWVSSTHLKEWYLKPSLEELGFHWDSAFPTAGNHWFLSLHHSSAQSRGSEHQFTPEMMIPVYLLSQSSPQVCTHKASPQAEPTAWILRIPSLPSPGCPHPHCPPPQTQTFPTSMDKALNLDCCAPINNSVGFPSEIARCPRLGSFLR